MSIYVVESLLQFFCDLIVGRSNNVVVKLYCAVSVARNFQGLEVGIGILCHTIFLFDLILSQSINQSINQSGFI